jgi:hypothetical protein
MFCDTIKTDEWVSVVNLQDNYSIELKEWEYHYGKELFVIQKFKIIVEMRAIKKQEDNQISVVLWDETIVSKLREFAVSFQVLDKFMKIFEV